MNASKSIFASKTFWLNVVGGVAAVAGAGVIPVKYSAPALALANIVTRLLTDSPAHVV